MITPPQAQGHVNRIASLLFADVASMKRWLSRVNYKLQPICSITTLELYPMLANLTVPTDDNSSVRLAETWLKLAENIVLTELL